MTIEMVTQADLAELTAMMERIERKIEIVQASAKAPSRLLDTKQTAEKLGLSAKTIQDWQLKREIPYRKIGKSVRFAEEDIQAIIDKG